VTVGTSAQPTITITALNGFTGTVGLTDSVQSGLVCDTISPSSITGSGAATVSCKPGILAMSRWWKPMIPIRTRNSAVCCWRATARAHTFMTRSRCIASCPMVFRARIGFWPTW
jgi:hypothetical protein